MLKENLTTIPILRGPNWELPFHIHTNTSNKVVGDSLGQVENKFPDVIYFISRKLSKVELDYIVAENELLVVVHSLKNFRH